MNFLSRIRRRAAATQQGATRMATAIVLATIALGAGWARANGIGEDSAWQFQTHTEKAARSATVDLMERKRGGYYQSFQTINNITNNTRIERQFNCALSATSAGNGGTNGMTATTSSPVVSNSGSTAAGATANSASNGIGYDIPAGVGRVSGVPGGSVGSTQGNSGSLYSGISGSSTSAATGSVSAGGSESALVLNSDQRNQNSQQVASIAGSTACAGPLN
jgi:hypothetical protein